MLTLPERLLYSVSQPHRWLPVQKPSTIRQGSIEARLEAGETDFVDYAADWVDTCKQQESVVNEIREANPAIDEKITFVRVDWDKFGTAEVGTSRKVQRRSTLLIQKGEEELGRIVSGTSAALSKAKPCFT